MTGTDQNFELSELERVIEEGYSSLSNVSISKISELSNSYPFYNFNFTATVNNQTEEFRMCRLVFFFPKKDEIVLSRCKNETFELRSKYFKPKSLGIEITSKPVLD